MIRSLFRACAVVVGIACAIGDGACQSANPLAPPLPLPRGGVEAGINVTSQSGTYYTDCGCPFTSGSGTGFAIGGVGEMFLTDHIEVAGSVKFQYISLTSTSTNDTAQMVYDPAANTIIYAPVSLNEQAVSHIGYIMLTPSIKYDIIGGLHVQAGISLGIAVASALSAEESIQQGGYTYQDGSATHQIQDGPIANVNAFRAAIAAGAGYDIPLSGYIFFTPAVSFEFPLTPVQSGTDWKIVTYQVTGAVTWMLHL